MTLTDQIDDVIGAPADGLLRHFFDREGPFAGSTFDEIGDNPVNSVGLADIVAVSLLDVRFEPRAVRALLEWNSTELSELLSDIPPNVDLWDADDRDLRAADALYRALDSIVGVGETKASKLLARKRPCLFPIIDSVIRRGLSLGSSPTRELRAALTEPSRRGAIELLRPSNISSSIPTIRLLDAAVWMRYSQSRNAKRARLSVGM